MEGLSGNLRKPWRLLGVGYYQAWIYLTVLSTALFTQPDFFEQHLQFTRQWFSLSLSLFLFCLIFVIIKLDLLGRRRFLVVVASLLSMAGTLLIAAPVADMSLKFAMVVCGIMMAGLGNAALVISWGMLWSLTDTDRMGLHIVTSNVFAGCLYLVVVQLPAEVAVFVTAVLPVCSAATLLSSNDEPRRKFPDVTARSGSMLGKALVAICMIPLIFGIARAFFSPSVMSDFSNIQFKAITGMTVLSVGVLALVVFAQKQRIVIKLYRLVVPLMAIGFAFLPFIPQDYRWASFAAIMCGFYSFEGLVWLLQPEFVFQMKKSTVAVFGWGRSLFHLFGFIGVTFGFAIQGNGLQTKTSFGVVCIVAVVLLIVISTYVFTEHDLRTFVEPIKAPPVDELHDKALFDEIAVRHGLSKREEEVLILLGKGRSVPFIAGNLFVSKGTVKTHVKHIYEKLDIHSKQELFDLLERK